jgi:hypothetical protein
MYWYFPAHISDKEAMQIMLDKQIDELFDEIENRIQIYKKSKQNMKEYFKKK